MSSEQKIPQERKELSRLHDLVIAEKSNTLLEVCE